MSPVLLLLVLGGVPLVEVAEAEPVAVFHVPDLGAALTAVESTAVKLAVQQGVPAPLRAVLGKRGGELLAAVYKGNAPGTTEISLWLDGAGPAVVLPVMRQFWLQLGYVVAERDDELEVLRRGQKLVYLGCVAERCAWSERRAHVAGLAVAATRPLGPLQPAVEGELALLQVDVAKVYGLVARSSRGARWAGIIRRLGVDSLTRITGTVRRRGRALVGELQLQLPRPAGLAAALAPPTGASLPAAPSNHLWLSLAPNAALVVGEKLSNYLAPVEYTLARAQLDAVERQRGQRLEALLGAAPQLWQLALDGAPVLFAGAAEPEAAASLLAALLGSLPAVMPDLAFKEGGTGPARVAALRLRGRELLAVGRRGQAVMLGPTGAAVVSGSRLAAGKTLLPGAMGGGELRLGALLRGLEPGLATALERARLSFKLEPRPEGPALEVELHGR